MLVYRQFFCFVLFFLLLFVNVDDLTAAINGSVSFCFARVLFVCVSSPDVEKFGAATRLSKPHQKRNKKNNTRIFFCAHVKEGKGLEGLKREGQTGGEWIAAQNSIKGGFISANWSCLDAFNLLPNSFPRSE